jgi:hypothetical protein
MVSEQQQSWPVWIFRRGYVSDFARWLGRNWKRLVGLCHSFDKNRKFFSAKELSANRCS